MKKVILLTGATGFLGSHLLAGLKDHYSVIILKRSHSDLGRVRAWLPEVIPYDVDHTPLEDIFGKHKIDGIIHAATDYGYHHNDEAIVASNVVFPLKLLRLGTAQKVSFFLNTDTFFNTEGYCYSHLSHYALSKKHFEDWLKQYAGGTTKILNLKLSHVYGPGDKEPKFVPTLLGQMLRNELSIALTGGKQRRDFVSIEEVVKAYQLLLEAIDHIQEPYLEVPVGTGKSVSIKEFVTRMHALSQSVSKLEFGKLPYREGEIMKHCADTTVLEKILHWKPRVDIQEGLAKLIQSEKKNYA